MMLKSLFLAVVVGTWNGNWFPSGRAEHRANDSVERATIRAAGRMLAKGIAEADPSGREDVIICLNEMRGPRVVRELAAAIGRTNLAVAVVTGYRRRDRYDMQQDAILTTLPVASANWSLWKRGGKTLPPRGYARAEIVLSPAVTAVVYAVHLKSNYGATDKPDLQAENRLKRTLAIGQLVEQERPRRGRAARPAIVAGDFNADRWRKEFSEEKIFAALEEAGFANALALLPEKSRGTHPNRRWGDSALDYVMVRGLGIDGEPAIVPSEELSDHSPVFVRVEVK